LIEIHLSLELNNPNQDNIFSPIC